MFSPLAGTWKVARKSEIIKTRLLFSINQDLCCGSQLPLMTKLSAHGEEGKSSTLRRTARSSLNAAIWEEARLKEPKPYETATPSKSKQRVKVFQNKPQQWREKRCLCKGWRFGWDAYLWLVGFNQAFIVLERVLELLHFILRLGQLFLHRAHISLKKENIFHRVLGSNSHTNCLTLSRRIKIDLSV